MKNKKIKIAFSIFFFALLCGCNSEIDLVKNGTHPKHPHTTIGKAIDSGFGDVKWKFFETNKGVRVVEATGLVGTDFFNDWGTIRKYCAAPQRLIMQFVFRANSDWFDIGACSMNGKEIDCDIIYDLIYQDRYTYKSMDENCARVKAEDGEK